MQTVTTVFIHPRLAEIHQNQKATNLVYRISEVVDKKNDFTSTGIKAAIANGYPFIKIIKELQMQTRSNAIAMCELLGEDVATDVLIFGFKTFVK